MSTINPALAAPATAEETVSANVFDVYIMSNLTQYVARYPQSLPRSTKRSQRTTPLRAKYNRPQTSCRRLGKILQARWPKCGFLRPCRFSFPRLAIRSEMGDQLLKWRVRYEADQKKSSLGGAAFVFGRVVWSLKRGVYGDLHVFCSTLGKKS